jgi:hypothetical protein
MFNLSPYILDILIFRSCKKLLSITGIISFLRVTMAYMDL